MDPEKAGNKLYLALAEKLSEGTGIETDVFTPAIISLIYSDWFVDALLSGYSIGYARENPDSGEVEFKASFTPDQLAMLRASFSGPFGQVNDIEEITEMKLPQEFIVSGIDYNEPDEERVLLDSEDFEVKETTHRFKIDQIKPDEPEQGSST